MTTFVTITSDDVFSGKAYEKLAGRTNEQPPYEFKCEKTFYGATAPGDLIILKHLDPGDEYSSPYIFIKDDEMTEELNLTDEQTVYKVKSIMKDIYRE